MLLDADACGGDFFDPSTWVPDTHQHRIYLTADLELYAIVDAVDYPAACVHTWSSLGSKWKRSHAPKHYARRTTQVLLAPEGPKYESPITGKIVRNRHRIVRSVFLHHFIAERAGIVPPTDFGAHVIFRLDHRNGNSLDCRRKNLRWVTPLFNTHNIRGVLDHVDPLEWHRMMSLKGAPHADN